MPTSRKGQQGAVAILVGIALVVLIGMLALVIDLGHDYLVKTGLQNGADAAALAGAKELDGTQGGVAAAAQIAIEVARQNEYAFFNPVGTDDADGGLSLSVGSCPDDGTCTMEPVASVTTDEQAADKTFLKVDTGPRDVGSWFAGIFAILGPNVTQLRTFGMAVAGRFLVQVTPMAVCAVNPSQPEVGFIRGVPYNIPDLNPLANGDPIWINPIDAAPGPCENNHTSVPNMTPFVCTGRTSTITSIPGSVWVDTGNKAAMDAPLNSRFGLSTSYTGGHACDPLAAPADTNVKEYICTRTGGGPNPDSCGNPPANSNSSPDLKWPKDWMDTTTGTIPTQQGITMSGVKPYNYLNRPYPEIAPGLPGNNFSKYGVLWSFSREMNYATNTEYGPGDWTNLYGGDAQNYPSTSPYLVFTNAPSGVGAANKTPFRRVLNLAIINCDGVVLVPGQSCKQTLPVIAVGKFFMQRVANLPGHIVGEFAGLLAPPMPPAEIRLYK